MNRLSQSIGILVGVVSLFWAGASLFTKNSQQDLIIPSVQHPEDDKALRVLQQEVMALRNRLAQIEHAQPNMASLHNRLTQLEGRGHDLQGEGNATASHDTVLLQREEISDSPTTEALQRERKQKLHALFATHFSREAPDPTWSHQTEGSLTHAVAHAAFEGSQLLTIGCRTSLCQMEVRHANKSAQAEFIEDFPFTLPFDTEVFYQQVEEAGGLTSTVIYLARAGQQLPTPTQ